MKVGIQPDERYPVYDFDAAGLICDVPDEKVAEWQRVMREWVRVQTEMEAAHRDAHGKRSEERRFSDV